MRYLDIDEILSEEERLPCVFLHDAAAIGSLDPTNDSADLLAQTKVELPLWMATVLTTKNMTEIELPKHYGGRIREELMAGATAVNLRDYSYYYFEFGLKLSKLTRDNDLRTTLKLAFAGDRYKALMARALSSWLKDVTEYTQQLTHAEYVLFNEGYTAARELLQWRAGQSNPLVAAPMIGKKSMLGAAGEQDQKRAKLS